MEPRVAAVRRGALWSRSSPSLPKTFGFSARRSSGLPSHGRRLADQAPLDGWLWHQGGIRCGIGFSTV